MQDKYRVAFNNANLLGIAGTTWDTFENHIKGIDLSGRQAHLRNQWDVYIRLNPNALFLLIILGSKNVDQFHNDIEDIPKKTIGNVFTGRGCIMN